MGENSRFVEQKKKGTSTMLFSFEGRDAKGSIIGRRAQRPPRRNIDLDKVSQVLRGSASDNLIAETGCFVFDSMFYGERNVPVTPTCLDCFFVVFFFCFFFSVSHLCTMNLAPSVSKSLLKRNGSQLSNKNGN